jgi:tRNA(fMet)-specific endonuclease VapC
MVGMKYLLDTEVCIIYLKGINLNLKQRLDSVPIHLDGIEL